MKRVATYDPKDVRIKIGGSMLGTAAIHEIPNSELEGLFSSYQKAIATLRGVAPSDVAIQIDTQRKPATNRLLIEVMVSIAHMNGVLGPWSSIAEVDLKLFEQGGSMAGVNEALRMALDTVAKEIKDTDAPFIQKTHSRMKPRLDTLNAETVSMVVAKALGIERWQDFVVNHIEIDEDRFMIMAKGTVYFNINEWADSLDRLRTSSPEVGVYLDKAVMNKEVAAIPYMDGGTRVRLPGRVEERLDVSFLLTMDALQESGQQITGKHIKCPKCKKPSYLRFGKLGHPGAIYRCFTDHGGCGVITVDCAGCGELYYQLDEDDQLDLQCPECGKEVAMVGVAKHMVREP